LKIKNPHGKNNFAEVSKNFAKYRFENNFELSRLLCRTLKHKWAAKNFYTLITNLNILYNYFDGQLVSDLYQAKFLNILVKSFLSVCDGDKIRIMRVKNVQEIHEHM